ncbi:MAG: CaiB/BaiF CoA-transferase family protein [Acidobacteriota bacterium]|nr:CaiB/BaiF CoA-transferase family protein [Acidobacteriota bacterium]
MAGPLDGVTVVTLEQAVAAPFATRQLADLGARVIKVERPQVGDFARAYDSTVKGLSSHFVWLNRSKESLTLDLKRPEASDVVSRLLERADVFVQNLAPGAAGRLGLDAGTLREGRPELIVCDVSGYGATGPYRDKKAYDLLVQAEAGLVSITGTETEPVKSSISVADIAAGMYAYSGVLTALFRRERTGSGATIEVSMLEALTEWMGFPLYYTMYGGSSPPRSGARHAAIAPYGPFAGADGETVFLGLQNEREWVRFCKQVLQRPELAVDARFESNAKRVEQRLALESEINSVFGKLNVEEIITRLELAKIANARMNTVAQLADHQQLAARQRWREVSTSVGPLRAMLPPATIDGVEARFDPIPDIGANTNSIMQELGYSAEVVSAWREDGLI